MTTLANSTAVGTGTPAGTGPYRQALRDLADRQAVFAAALADVEHVLDAACRAAPVDLHRRLRAMAATSRQALGTWPERAAERDPQ